jgi:hypothetical protein
VAGVLWGGLSLLRTVIASYAKELSPLEVHYGLEKLMPIVGESFDTQTPVKIACANAVSYRAMASVGMTEIRL